MPRDFTITIYRTLLESIKDAGYTFRTFYDYMCEPENTKKIVILRHDIDANPGKALEFAVLENELGIRSTFYFKTTQGVYNEKIDLFPQPLQSAFRPAPFGMVPADGDDNIIGEPVIVDRLVVPFCRFAAHRVEEPVDLVQIDIRRQRAERTPLRDPDRSRK